jgi:hypothetical protein
VAKRLDVDTNRVRQRIYPRSLYAFTQRGVWLVPALQLERRTLVPGLDAVVAALSPMLHPVAVSRWFTTPNNTFGSSARPHGRLANAGRNEPGDRVWTSLRAQAWAQAAYDAYPNVEGLWYLSSMHRGSPALALFERAADALPKSPDLDVPLSHHGLLPDITRAAARSGICSCKYV